MGAELWWKELDALAELHSFKLDVAALLEAHHNHYREGSSPAEAIAAIISSRPQERPYEIPPSV